MNWVKCSERLPEENQIILLYTDEGWELGHEYCIATYEGYDAEQEYIYCECACYPPIKNCGRYWQSLPEPPKGDE